MKVQLSLFDSPAQPAHDCIRNGPCKTCGATRPDDHRGHMFLEPVSSECGQCNRATVEAILDAVRQRDESALIENYRRHLGGSDWTPKRSRPARR